MSKLVMLVIDSNNSPAVTRHVKECSLTETVDTFIDFYNSVADQPVCEDDVDTVLEGDVTHLHITEDYIDVYFIVV